MTRAETTAVFLVLRTAYPNFYAKQTETEINRAIDLWREMFADDSAEIVANAVKMFIVTDNKGFPPSIGIIKNKIAELKNSDEMTEYEAWNYVKKAISNGIYSSSEEYEKLPPELQRLVGSPNKLREWAQMDSERVESVIGSNFMRSYRARAVHEREYSMLPKDVKNFMNMLAEKMKLDKAQKRELTEFEVNERRNEIQRLLKHGDTSEA